MKLSSGHIEPPQLHFPIRPTSRSPPNTTQVGIKATLHSCMAFRKRNVGIQRNPALDQQSIPGGPASAPSEKQKLPGVRPSPLTGQPTTSTGVHTLDAHLGGHAGLALGTSLLVEESGTTDFAGALLKFYAAEGLAQGHEVHVVGAGPQWSRELPGQVGVVDRMAPEPAEPDSNGAADQKMKIAWRYERLGQHDAARPGGVAAPRRGPDVGTVQDDGSTVFCHMFDLAKRLTVPASATIHHIATSDQAHPTAFPFETTIQALRRNVDSSRDRIHRIVIPSLLSPALYPAHAANPEHFLRFLHSLRALLRQHFDRLTILMTLPIELFPRSSGLVKWAEHLADGVVELQPFPHVVSSSNPLSESGGARATDDQPQGLLKFHKLPALTERGLGLVGDDLAFSLSRRRFTIRPFSLPPMEEEERPAKAGESAGVGALGAAKKADIEF